MAEFAEVAHFRDPRKAADILKLDDRWSPGTAAEGQATTIHHSGTSNQVNNGLSGSSTGTRSTMEPRVEGILLDTQKVYEGRTRELANR